MERKLVKLIDEISVHARELSAIAEKQMLMRADAVAQVEEDAGGNLKDTMRKARRRRSRGNTRDSDRDRQQEAEADGMDAGRGGKGDGDGDYQQKNSTKNKNTRTATPSSPPPAFCFLRVVRHPSLSSDIIVQRRRTERGEAEETLLFFLL